MAHAAPTHTDGHVHTRSPWDFHLNDNAALDGKLVEIEPESTDVTIVRGGTLLDGRGGRRENATVVIRGARVAGVYDGAPPRDALSAEDEAAARVIDATGMTVLPGMVDAHIHFGGRTSADPYREYFTPSEGVKFLRSAFEYYQTLEYGFTTVRFLGHGQVEHAYALRQALLEGLIRGPRMLSSGWALSQTRGHGDVPQLPYDWVEHERPRSLFCDSELECRVAARRNFGECADVIKVYSSDNRTGRPDFTVEELAAVADEAHRRGKRVATHAKTYEGVRNALLAGIDTIEHGTPDVHHDLLEMMLEQGTCLVPTIATPHLIAVDGKTWGASQASIDSARREVEGRQDVVRIASEMGVKIVTGSDTGGRANFGLLSARELKLLVEAGLTPMQAISAATSTAADALGLADDIGVIEAGKIGELLVVDGDPLADIALFEDPSHLRTIVQVRDPLTF